MTKPPGYIVQLRDGSLVIDAYGTVILFRDRDDADLYIMTQTDGEAERIPLVRWRRPRKKATKA